ncbi:MAG: hypothetical protein HYZ28_07970 [Myxococcales bacterium]|nr:hypothetical protein [Myxococcales bacterium]
MPKKNGSGNGSESGSDIILRMYAEVLTARKSLGALGRGLLTLRRTMKAQEKTLGDHERRLAVLESAR